MCRSRTELAGENGLLCFLFPTEVFALDAAYLDVALVVSPGAYVRHHNHEAAFAVSDGVRIFRLYYYSLSSHGQPTVISPPPRGNLRPYREGPAYWQLLPGWKHGLERDRDPTRPGTSRNNAMLSPLNIMKTQEAPVNSDGTIPRYCYGRSLF